MRGHAANRLVASSRSVLKVEAEAEVRLSSHPVLAKAVTTAETIAARDSTRDTRSKIVIAQAKTMSICTAETHTHQGTAMEEAPSQEHTRMEHTVTTSERGTGQMGIPIKVVVMEIPTKEVDMGTPTKEVDTLLEVNPGAQAGAGTTSGAKAQGDKVRIQTGAGTTCLAIRVVKPHGVLRKEVAHCREETSMATHQLRITERTRRSNTWVPSEVTLTKKKIRGRPRGGTTHGTQGGQKTRSRLS